MTDCIHYWLIDSNNHGTCKYCGSKRKFPAWIEIDTPALQQTRPMALVDDSRYCRSTIFERRSNETFKSYGIYL